MNNSSTITEVKHGADGVISQIDDLKRELNLHLYAVREQRNKHPNGTPYTISEKSLNKLYDHFQLVRELGERIDFNRFSEAMVRIEELLKKLRTPVQFRRTDILNDLNDIVNELEMTVKKRTQKP